MQHAKNTDHFAIPKVIDDVDDRVRNVRQNALESLADDTGTTGGELAESVGRFANSKADAPSSNGALGGDVFYLPDQIVDGLVEPADTPAHDLRFAAVSIAASSLFIASAWSMKRDKSPRLVMARSMAAMTSGE